MSTTYKVFLFLIAFLLFTVPAVAGGVSPDKVSYLALLQSSAYGVGSSASSGVEDEQLAFRQADFERFAQAKIQEFDRNSRFSRSRMQISRQPSGMFRAIYHQIDGKSLTFKVSRSQSKAIPFVGVLAYREQVFEVVGATPEECRRNGPTVVAVIPNRHIFSYGKDAWN